jgi:hypothetical protein
MREESRLLAVASAFTDAPEARESISVSSILDRHFRFKEKGFGSSGLTYFIASLNARSANAARQPAAQGMVFSTFVTHHLPFSARCAPRDRAGLLSAVPLKRDWIVERPYSACS